MEDSWLCAWALFSSSGKLTFGWSSRLFSIIPWVEIGVERFLKGWVSTVSTERAVSIIFPPEESDCIRDLVSQTNSINEQ